MSGQSIDWIHDMGVKFYKHAIFQGEADKPYGLYGANDEVRDRTEIQYGGRFLIQPMIDKLKTTRVQILMETEVTELIQGSDGKVTGVIAKDRVTGDTITINTKTIILAAGRNSRAGQGAVQGLDLARRAGAAFKIYDDLGKLGGAIFGFGGLYVNRNGERFVDEGGFYERVFREARDSNQNAGLNDGNMRNHENYYCFMIVDSGSRRNNTKPRHTPSGRDHTWDELLTEVENYGTPAYKASMGPYNPGEIYSGNTLAEAIGKVPDSLMTPAAKQRAVQTVAAYNADIADGRDDAFGKDVRDPNGNGMPVGNTGPFYIWRVQIVRVVYPDTPDGGTPRINANAEMLKSGDIPIPGLYGAGTLIANELEYSMYPGSGTYIQFAVSTGRIASNSAAAYIRAK
jgi:hypothetical protein